MEFDKVLDSGNRQEFSTGSRRDTAEGKGTPHLVAGEVMRMLSTDGDAKITTIENLLFSYNCPNEPDRRTNLFLIKDAAKLAIENLIEEENGSYAEAMRRFSRHYENGIAKYGKNNWRKGQPISRYYDSAMRHLWKIFDDTKDEDHGAALLWNLTCILQTKHDIDKGFLPKEIDDFPFTKEELFGPERPY